MHLPFPAHEYCHNQPTINNALTASEIRLGGLEWPIIGALLCASPLTIKGRFPSSYVDNVLSCDRKSIGSAADKVQRESMALGM